MGKVLYSMNVSLDGYIEDANGSIEFSTLDEEVHRLANEQARQTSVFLFGRRPLRGDGGAVDDGGEPRRPARRRSGVRPHLRETPRIVFSDTLDSVPEGVRLVRSKDSVEEVTRLKQQTEGELDLGGASLAASLIDLVDEFRLYVMPVVLGGGKPFFAAGKRLRLRLAEHHALASGTVYLRYERAD
ncbi:MAG TPA: dihydrofolate reductase family protein [Jiangellaceae bacterium]|nr:dihydrofolate reductase family protein [Jiangellaceae bacterium]